MGYTAPTTLPSGYFVTPTEWNRDLVDNVAFLANPPACRVLHGSDQAMAFNTATTVTFTGVESFDSASMHSTSVEPQRITFPVAGVYLVTFHCLLTSASDYNYVFGAICKNAVLSGEIIDGGVTDMDTAEAPHINFGGLYKFAANDYVSVYLKQHNAASASRNALFLADRSPVFSAIWQGIG